MYVLYASGPEVESWPEKYLCFFFSLSAFVEKIFVFLAFEGLFIENLSPDIFLLFYVSWFLTKL